MHLPECGEGLVPSRTYEHSRIAGLKGHAAWLWLPAAAMAVSLGVTLPGPASAQTAITGAGPVTLQTDYPGQSSFTVAGGQTIDGGASLAAIYGDNSQTWTLNNAGHIQDSAAGSAGINLAGPATVTNSGTASYISGTYAGVYINGGAGTVTNEGTIFGAAMGVGLSSGDNSVFNRGTASYIAGDFYGVRIDGSGTVINEGIITVGPLGSGDAVYIRGDGAVTNGGTADGTAILYGGHDGVYIGGAGTVTNFGAITGQYNHGVSIFGDGTVTNGGTANNTAAITGYYDGVKMDSDGAVTNFGAITGRYNQGVSIHGDGAVTNGGAANGTAAITGYYDGVKIRGAADVTNFGAITGTMDTGVYISGGGTVTNHAGGVITGYIAGVELDGAPGAVVNYGSISGDPGGGLASAGIAIQYGGRISNLGTASSISGGLGIVLGGATTIVNQGRITGSYIGVYGGLLFGPQAGIAVQNSGTIAGGLLGVSLTGADIAITNSGAITGGYVGVLLTGLGSTVTNSGAITGGDAGVALGGGGNVTNSGAASVVDGGQYGVIIVGQASVHNEGTIRGAFGVYFTDPGPVYNNTVFNSGAVVSTYGAAGAAVSFGAGDDRLILGAGYSFTGTVEGGAGVNTIEISSGTAHATGLGTEFLDFQEMVIDPGGTLALVSGDMVPAGFMIVNAGTATSSGDVTMAGTLTSSGTIRNSGSLHVTGTLTNSGSFANSGTLTGDTDGLVSGGGQITNSGTITGTANDGVLMTGGTLTNTGLVRGGRYGVVVSGGTVINGGAILDDAAAGASLGSNAGFTNAAGGTLSGVTGLVFTGANASLTNSGAITGSGGVAIRFDASANTVTLDTGSVLNGRIDGGGGPGRILLTGSGTLDNTIANFGADGGLTVSSGAAWTAGGNWTIANVGNAGTLTTGALGIAGALANSGTILNSGSLDVTGTLSNTGMLRGSGTLSLTGLLANSGAVANDGAIQVTGALANNGTILNSGTLHVTGTLANSGSLDNSGTLTGDTDGLVSGGGRITNSGTITGTANDGVILTGGTLSNTGLVQGGKHGVVASGGAVVINNGAILDDAAAAASLGGNAGLTNNAGGTLSGATGVVFTGTGSSLTNFGAITGAGGVAIQFGAGADTATLGTGSVLNGRIDGGGGPGRILLTGSGTLDNTIANFGAGSGLTVSGGAAWTVGGNWAIAGVSNAGMLKLGATPLTIDGNFAQTPGGALQAVLDASGAGSQILVSGAASLAGPLAIIPTGTFALGDTRFTLVDAAGGVSGGFSAITGGTALLTASLSYDAHDAFVTITQLPAASAALGETPNQFAVATAFDAGRAVDRTGFTPVLIALDRLGAAGVKAGLDTMSGENIVDLSTVGLMAGRQFGAQLLRHNLLTHGSGSGWTVWGSASGQSGHLDGDGNTHRLDEGVSGLALGADTAVAPGLRLGGAVGFGGGHFHAGATGSGRVQYTQIAMTGSYADGLFYIDAAVGSGFGSATTRRAIAIPGAAAQATGHAASGQFLGSFEAGYNVAALNRIDLTPFLRIETGSVSRDAFSETGAGVLNLSAPAQSAGATESVLGARLGGDLPLGDLPLKADLSLGWRHELSDTVRAGLLSFAGAAGTDFRIAAAGLPGDAADLGFGLSTAVSDTGSAWLHYDGGYSKHSTSHALTFGFRFAW